MGTIKCEYHYIILMEKEQVIMYCSEDQHHECDIQKGTTLNLHVESSCLLKAFLCQALIYCHPVYQEEGKGRSDRKMVMLKTRSSVLANTRPRDHPHRNCFKPSQNISASGKWQCWKCFWGHRRIRKRMHRLGARFIFHKFLTIISVFLLVTSALALSSSHLAFPDLGELDPNRAISIWAQVSCAWLIGTMYAALPNTRVRRCRNRKLNLLPHKSSLSKWSKNTTLFEQHNTF